MLRGVFIKAKNNFPFLVVSITILTLLTLNFLLPIQEHESKAATPAEITKTSTVDWNKGEMTSVDGSSNELKISKSSGWVDENYLYREQLPVTAKTDNAIPKGFTLNSANVASGTFDGSGDWFDVGTNFNETLPVTIEAWVNLKSWNSHIFSSRETVTSNYNGFWMYVDGAGKVFLSYGDNTGQLSTSRRSKYGDTVIALDTWTHITGVIRGATDMSIYVNGVDANGAYSGTGGAMANAPTSSARIGWRNVAVNPMMKGNIDELRVWSKARSQAEILADMNKEITAQASLDAYYKFNQTTGSLVDDSGNSHTGTAGGNANYAPYSNVWGGVNTKALVDAGKMRSDGNDLRVYYGSVEIERELIPANGKTLATSEATQVLFKSQAAVASAQTDNNYYIYYGDSDATDPIVSVYNKMIRTRNAYITPYAGNGANYLQYNADNFPTNGDGTIELWFKYSNSEQHNYTTPLLSGEDTNNTWSWWYDRSGYRVVGKIGGNDIALVGANHNNGGEWNNLVITWHNTGSGSEIKTYENNVLTANKTDGTTIASWPNYIKLTDSVSTYDGVEVGKIGIYNTVKDATWVSTGYTSNAVAPITDGQRDSSATLLHNFDGDGFDATSINGGYASGTTAAISQGMVMSGDYRMGDTFDERAGNAWVSGVYNWYDNFDAINSKSPGWTEYGDINNVSNELRLAKNGQQLLMNRLSANTPTNYRIDVSAKGTQPEILFNHQGKIGWWGNNICSTNISGGGDGATDLGQPKDAATNFLTGATSKYYLGMYNGFIPKYIQFDLGTNGNYSSIVWEYWNGSVWTAFSPTTDGTANFSKSGIVDVSNISASYGANPAADGACGFNGNFNVIRVSAGTVTTPATIKQVNRIIDFAKLSYSATTNAISGDSHNASGSTAISRSTSAYKQIGLRRVGTGLQSFYDNYQSINTSTNSIFDTNFLGLSSTTDATYDDFKMYKALSDEPSLTVQSEVAKYPLGSGNTYLSPSSTSAESGILDAGWIGGWGTPNGFRANVTIPANTSIQFQIRSSAIGGANNNDWTAWADVGTATTSGAYDILTASMPNITLGLNRYLQLKAGLATTDGSNTPVLSDYTVYYSGDGQAPTDPTISTVNVGGSSVSDGSWINFNGATNFNFSGSTDSESGVAGYYIYFGTDVNGTPVTYQAHSGAVGDTQTYSTVIANSDDGKHYHFKIKALDIAGNSSEAVELYDFGYDNTAPLRPAFVSANPSGYTTQNSYAFTWPTATDPVGAGGSASGIKWYEYKTFADAAWSHTANANVTTVSGIQAYKQGVNGFYVRTVDQVGNYSEDQQVTYYSSGDAPAKPSNLTVDPTTSDQNVFCCKYSRWSL